MKSPFPGMDPYIEACGLFEDFHFDLIAEIKNELARALPSGYIVKTGERAYVILAQADGTKESVFLPDVGVLSPPSAPPALPAGIAVAEPEQATDAVSMRAFISTEFRENFIEVYTTHPDRLLVTSIEVLSPSNKRSGPGRDVYLRKRQGLLMGTANFIELDLLRGGEKMPMLDPWPNSPFTVFVARKLFAPHCRVWPAHLRRPLPTIPVPLLHPDPDIPLNLQPMIEAIYERFHYDSQIDYSRLPTLPLCDDDAKWLAEQLRQRATSG